LIDDRRMIDVALDHNRVTMTLNINRPGRTILVMLILPVLIAPICVTALAIIIFPSICQRNAGANKDHDKCNCEYFHNVGFNGVLLFPLKLPLLDETIGRRGYMGFMGETEGLGLPVVAFNFGVDGI
jgi:hypothetical protein